MAVLVFDRSKQFLLLFLKNCMLCHQTFQKCFFFGSNGESLISAVSSHRINHNFISIHIRIQLSCEQRAITLILPRLKLGTKKIILIRNDTDVNEQERLSKYAFSNKLKVRKQLFYCCSTFHSHCRVF